MKTRFFLLIFFGVLLWTHGAIRDVCSALRFLLFRDAIRR